MNHKLRKVERLYSATRHLLLEIVEEEARHILREHPELDEFVMAMGAWFFTIREAFEIDEFYYDKNDPIDEKDFDYLTEFANIFCEWNSEYKLTGEPMRFTAHGPKVTD